MLKKINVEVFDITVPKERLIDSKLKVSEFSENIDEYDAILLLNNDFRYKRYIQEKIKNINRTEIAFYDPWRIVITGKEKIFQTNFPIQLFNR
tara:strand:- start:398 stop:676 length:279 start_codon:yes stop_codon:yes gene_type:complete